MVVGVDAILWMVNKFRLISGCDLEFLVLNKPGISGNYGLKAYKSSLIHILKGPLNSQN
jgi:hypothetical protein